MKKEHYIGNTYRIVQKLGEGGTASVYLVLHRRTMKLFALKQIPLHGRVWTGAEREYLRHLNHPGLPEILDLFEEDGCACLVMEYLSGKTLWEWKQEGEDFSEGELLRYMEELLLILQYLHTRVPPLIHGDIKPSNLILDTRGRLRLLDFGAAFVKDREAGPGFGTCSYASPEQLNGYPAMDQRSDLYSFGRTFRALTGGKESRELGKILDKCTEINRIHRYASAREVRGAVLELRKKRQKKKRILCFLAVSLLALISVWISESRRAKEELQYQTQIQSHQVSRLVSAVRSFPGREEAYQKLLQVFLEDESFSREESTKIEEILAETEGAFQENQEGYSAFCYELGLAYWYFFAGQGGKQYGADWFGKAALGGLSEKRADLAGIYERLGNYYVKRTIQGHTGGSEEARQQLLEIWEDAQALPEQKRESEELLALIQEEIQGLSTEYEEEPMDFQRNSQGSSFEFSTGARTLMEQYYVKKGSSFSIIEKNVDKLLEKAVVCVRNGTFQVLKEGWDYQVKVRKENWGWRYEYQLLSGYFQEEGHYSVIVQSKDEAGNQNDSRSLGTVEFYVDRTAPQSFLLGLETEVQGSLADTLETGMEKREIQMYARDEGGLSLMELWMDGKKVVSAQGAQYRDWILLPEGIREFQILARDKAGNQAWSENYVVQVGTETLQPEDGVTEKSSFGWIVFVGLFLMWILVFRWGIRKTG